MFFKKRYFRFSRAYNKIFYLFNLFFCFNKNSFEFFGYLGFIKINLKFLSFLKNGNFLNIFNFFSYYQNKKYFNNGYIYSLIFNSLRGLFINYEKRLTLSGLGYKVFLRSNFLYFYLSYSHPIIYNIPKDIDISLNSNELIIKGINKQRVGEVSLFLKNFKKPDRYKGKGIKYSNEKFILKVFKKK